MSFHFSPTKNSLDRRYEIKIRETNVVSIKRLENLHIQKQEKKKKSQHTDTRIRVSTYMYIQSQYARVYV